MEILKQATSIASKYGISFYRFDPFLSFVNKKLGICIKLKTKDFGYLTRNFTFENLEQYEDFIKRYSYYKNKLKCKSGVRFDNYLDENPKLIYDFDEEELIKNENEKIELDAIIDSGLKLKAYIENLYEARLEQIIKRNNTRLELDSKLNQYKKNLYAYYNKHYEEAISSPNNSFNIYQVKVKKNLNLIDKYLLELEHSKNVYDAKKNIRKIITFLEEIEKDEEYFSIVYDIYFYKNKITVLEKMNLFVLKMLNSENKISYQELKVELDILKESIPFNNTRDNYINACLLDVESNYKGIEEIQEYNYFNFISKNKLENLKFKELKIESQNGNKSNLIEQYDNLNDFQKNCLVLLFSPFRNIIEYIMKEALQNTLENADFSQFSDFYDEMLEIIEKPENVILVDEYFSNINFADYQQFVNSLIDISEVIYNIQMYIKEQQSVWSSFEDSNFIICYENPIKSNNVTKINLKTNSIVLYSEKSIRFKSSDSTCLEIIENNEVILLKNKNTLEFDNNCLEVADFKYETEEIDGNLIVTNIMCDKLYKYDIYNCCIKDNNEIK